MPTHPTTPSDQQWRKKPVVIEAFQFTRETRASNEHWPEWMRRAWNETWPNPGALSCEDFPNSKGDDRLVIATLEGVMTVNWNDWIIRGVNGELYPCKPDIFAMTYEPAQRPTASAPRAEGVEWTEGVKFAVREMARHPVAFCTDSMVDVTAKLIVDAALAHKKNRAALSLTRELPAAELGEDAIVSEYAVGGRVEFTELQFRHFLRHYHVVGDKEGGELDADTINSALASLVNGYETESLQRWATCHAQRIATACFGKQQPAPAQEPRG